MFSVPHKKLPGLASWRCSKGLTQKNWICSDLSYKYVPNSLCVCTSLFYICRCIYICWVCHCFIYYFATRQRLADVTSLLSLEEKKLMSSGQIRTPTPGEEDEGLWGCCCQLSVFVKTRGRDHTHGCSEIGTLTNPERENSASSSGWDHLLPLCF